MKKINKPSNFEQRVLRAKVVSIGVEERGQGHATHEYSPTRK